MSRMKIFLFFILYAALIILLFKGIKIFEAEVKTAWYEFITKRNVTRISHIPIGNCILGIYKPELPYSFRLMWELEGKIGRHFTLVSWYQAWGSLPEHKFQTILMDNIANQGTVPLLTWEPWVSDFTVGGLKPMPEREHRYLKDIAAGVYDFHISEWAREAVTWGKPFFLRFAHEMTNPQYPWSQVNGNQADDFIYAWRHVHDLFDSLGAANVIWVWCPYGTDVLRYYPGHEYVDWIAIDIFNYGELLRETGGMRWMSFDQLTSPIYTEVAPLNKPIMVAETASSDIGGNRAVWYREMFTQIFDKFTSIKALVLFENPSDQTSGSWNIDWSVSNSEEIIGEVKSALDNPYFTHIPDYMKRLSKNK